MSGPRPLSLVAKPQPVPPPTGGRVVPRILGILNVTPDSFSDGGRHAAPDAALAAARAMINAGAAMVDIGGESTRPGAPPVSEAEEIARVAPVLERLTGSGIPFSIDTRNAAVMARAVDAGAAMVNDVSALTHDARALPAIARRNCDVVLMHMQGTPATMQVAPHYEDVVVEVHAWLVERIRACVAGGIARSRIVIDPGIGFGKTVEHNLTLLRGLSRFRDLGCPVMLGASRKGFIGGPVEGRLPGSLVLAVHAAAQGVSWVRVHDVPETLQALQVWAALNR
ncbi:dihydropteroate synthase [Sphingosinicellaceae bacterium]|nr:dihydropteroate synthase [Sphingosinicellaceae bacterium]